MAGIIAVLALTATLMAGVPALINYQGRLTNSAGNPLDTTIQMIFSFYGDSTGGSPIWADTIGSVAVANGLFNAMLGVWDPGDGSYGDDTIKFFGIAVGADPEITPRTHLATSIYSFHSGTVASIDSARGGTIIGNFAIAPNAAKEDMGKAGTAVLDFGGATPFLFATTGTTPPFPGTFRVYGNNTTTPSITLDGLTGQIKMPTGAANGLVLTSDANGVGSWQVAGSDQDWDKMPPFVATEYLQTHGALGIARSGNTLWGTYRNTHINLGDGCTTGRNGQSYGWATVSGGQANEAIGNFATVGGGILNKIGNGNVPSGDEARVATIAGGYANEAHAVGTSIGGGQFNIAYDQACAVGGGWSNQAGLSGGSLTDAYYAYVGGGMRNYAQASFSTIGGGYYNKAVGIKSTIGGGDSNYVSLDFTTIGGGHANYVINYAGTDAGGEFDTVLARFGSITGGQLNFIGDHADWGTVGGGMSNFVNDSGGSILGGEHNSTSGSYSTIGGGKNNQAGGHGAAIPGGRDNIANGRFSLAAGQAAQAMHMNSFVWNDNSAGAFASTNNNQFLIHADGNTGIMTNSPNSTLHDSGSIAVAITVPTVAPGYPIGNRDCIVLVNAAGMINLPPAAGVGGRMYTIKNVAPGVGAIVNVMSPMDFIDGTPPGVPVPLAQWRAMTFASNGTNTWYIIASY